MRNLIVAVRTRTGRSAAVGFLLLVAATIGLWSGPLAAASGELHSSGVSPAHAMPGHAKPAHAMPAHADR